MWACRILGLWASLVLYFFIFLITQGLHTLNNKTLVAVLNKKINREIDGKCDDKYALFTAYHGPMRSANLSM